MSDKPKVSKVSEDLLSRLLYGIVKGMVFERLGTIEDKLPAKEFSEEEKLSLGEPLLDMIERAAGEFIQIKRERVRRRQLEGRLHS